MKKFFVIATVFCVAALAASNAFAQTPVGVRAVGVQGAWVNPDELDATYGFNAFVDVGIPLTSFVISPFIDYWSKTTESALDPNIETSFRDWAVGGTLKWTFPVPNPIFQPFVGGGLAAHMLKSEISDAILGSIDVSDTKIGWHVGGGSSFGLGASNWSLQTEAWYTDVDGFNTTQVKAGLAFRI